SIVAMLMIRMGLLPPTILRDPSWVLDATEIAKMQEATGGFNHTIARDAAAAALQRRPAEPRRRASVRHRPCADRQCLHPHDECDLAHGHSAAVEDATGLDRAHRSFRRSRRKSGRARASTAWPARNPGTEARHFRRSSVATGHPAGPGQAIHASILRRDR